MRKKLSLVAAIAAMGLVFGVSTPAQATTGSVTFQCSTTLFWPTPSGSGASCSGLGVGAVVNTDATASAGLGGFFATVDTYSEQCIADEPLTGTANGTASWSGTITTGGPLSTNYSWLRVGATAVVTTSPTIGAAVAVFVPISPVPPPNCSNPTFLTAQVVGEALLVL